jgi:hypothetical protein
MLNLFAGTTPATLVVVLSVDGPHSPDAISEMQREASRLLAAGGIDITWRFRAEASEEFADDVALIKLKGTCRMELTGAPTGEPGALGRTYTSNGAVIPFGDVACDSVRSAVRLAMHRGDLPRAGFLYGRALGRVLAHELYHIAHRTPQHGRGDFTQPSFSGQELLADSGSILLAFRASHH